MEMLFNSKPGSDRFLKGVIASQIVFFSLQTYIRTVTVLLGFIYSSETAGIVRTFFPVGDDLHTRPVDKRHILRRNTFLPSLCFDAAAAHITAELKIAFAHLYLVSAVAPAPPYHRSLPVPFFRRVQCRQFSLPAAGYVLVFRLIPSPAPAIFYLPVLKPFCRHSDMIAAFAFAFPKKRSFFGLPDHP